MITSNCLSPTQPGVTGLGTARGGGSESIRRCPPFSAAAAHLSTVGHPFCPPLCCFSVAIWTFSSVPVCLSEVFRFFSCAGRRFLPPSRRGSYPGIGLASHMSTTLIIGCLLVCCGATACPDCRLSEPGWLPNCYIPCLQLEGLIECFA